MAGGWVQISRKLLEWQWHDEPNMVVVWIFMLLSANYETKKWHGITIQRGQFVSTISAICTQTGLSARNVRTCIQRLVDDGSIIVESTNKTTIFTIISYDDYQNDSKSENDKINSETSNSKSANYRQNNFVGDKQTTNKRQINDKQNSEKTTNKKTSKQTEKQELTIETSSETTNERQPQTAKNDNNIINNNIIIPPPPPHTREENTEREKLKALFSDTRVQQLIVSRTEMNIENAVGYIDEFINQCEVRGQQHKSDTDLAEHFINWLQIKTKKYLSDAANSQNTAGGNNKPDRDEQRDTRVSSVIQEAMRLISTGRDGD